MPMQIRSVLGIAAIAISALCGDAISAAAPAAAPPATGAAQSANTSPPQTPIDTVLAKLKALRPDLPIEGASAAPIPGMITIELSGGSSLYATADGKYLIAGDLYQMGDTLVNLAEQARDEKRKALIAGVSVNDMAVFPAQGHRKAVITVFTDVDCGYCRKLHLEVPAMNKMGVEVRYLAYPRSGVGSPSYDKLVTAWCSTNRQDAITRMKRGEELPPKTCVNPVAHEYELGQMAGLTGTPAIVLEDGRMLPGYMSADELGHLLGII
jgi:thiol:disulfide interchange protein DsbC